MPKTGRADCWAAAINGHVAAPPMSVMNSRRFIAALRLRTDIVAVQTCTGKGSDALRTAIAMSALHPKADVCGATRDVRFGPKADIASPSDSHSPRNLRGV